VDHIRQANIAREIILVFFKSIIAQREYVFNIESQGFYSDCLPPEIFNSNHPDLVIAIVTRDFMRE
jgi:hypothetical protein